MASAETGDQTPGPALFVRLTHWFTAAAFFALLLSGTEIVVSHPRFYWGETGNVLTTPLFQLVGYAWYVGIRTAPAVREQPGGPGIGEGPSCPRGERRPGYGFTCRAVNEMV